MADGRSDADADTNAASDSESVNALLSPSDGFFSRACVPNEVLVPDPRQRNTQADKEREARGEPAVYPSTSRGDTAAQAPSFALPHRPLSASSWRSSIVNTEAEDRDPLMPAAPPAYADIAQDTNTGRRVLQGANTMGQPESFFPSRSPQDLGGTETQPLLGHDASPPRRSWRDALRKGSRWCKALVIVSIVLFGMAILAALVAQNHEPKHRDHSLPGPAAGARPVPASCRHAIFTDRDNLTIKTPPSFHFVEKHQNPRGRRHQLVDISGEVRLQTLHDQKDGVKFDVECRSNQERLLDEVSVEFSSDASLHEDTIDLLLPRYWKGSNSNEDRACLDIDITISVSPGTSFEQLTLSLRQLSIGIVNVDYNAKSTILGTRTGSIRSSKSHSIESREIRLHSDVGSVAGAYPLYDLLSIETGVGDVQVHVDPKKADNHKLPARFLVESNTGSVTVTASPDDVPSRDYQTSIVTGTGKISIENFIHGSSTELRSRVASITAVNLYPVGNLHKNSSTDVNTLTGSIDVGLTPHMWSPDKRMRHFNGRYISSTGAVQVTHPLQWEGTVRAHTGVGSLDIDWPGLTQNDADDGKLPPWLFPGSEFEGVKGKGDALVDARSGTGSVQLFGQDTK